MRKSKNILILSALVMIIAFLVGCGNVSRTTQAPAPQTTTEEPVVITTTEEII